MELLEFVAFGIHFIGMGIGFSISFYFIKKIYGTKKPLNEILPFLGMAFLFLFLSMGSIFNSYFRR